MLKEIPITFFMKNLLNCLSSEASGAETNPNVLNNDYCTRLYLALFFKNMGADPTNNDIELALYDNGIKEHINN